MKVGDREFLIEANKLSTHTRVLNPKKLLDHEMCEQILALKNVHTLSINMTAQQMDIRVY